MSTLYAITSGLKSTYFGICEHMQESLPGLRYSATNLHM